MQLAKVESLVIEKSVEPVPVLKIAVIPFDLGKQGLFDKGTKDAYNFQFVVHHYYKLFLNYEPTINRLSVLYVLLISNSIYYSIVENEEQTEDKID